MDRGLTALVLTLKPGFRFSAWGVCRPTKGQHIRIDGSHVVLTLSEHVEARIVAGLSQNDLAERLDLQEQQIQRYEATDYCSASLTRLKEIAKALGMNIAGEMTYSG